MDRAIERSADGWIEEVDNDEIREVEDEEAWPDVVGGDGPAVREVDYSFAPTGHA